MKSFTKLTVLLLTLALLVTSVFAITAFAADEAAPASSENKVPLLQADATSTTVGAIANNASQGAGANRYGTGTYRDLTQKTNGKLVEVVSRDPIALGETYSGSAQIQFSMRSNATETLNNYEYLVYDLEIGTYNNFIQKTDGSAIIYFTFGGDQGKTGRNLYIYERDGEAIIGTNVSSGMIGSLGTLTESGLEARLTVVAQINKEDSANSTLFVFINGAYAKSTTLGADVSAKADASMRMWINDDDTANYNLELASSVYINSASIHTVSGSSKDVEGDLAALVNEMTNGNENVKPYLHLANWANNGVYSEEDVASDPDTVGVKISIDGSTPLYVQCTVDKLATYSTSSTAPKTVVFDWGTDVSLTLLEDMTITAIVSGTGTGAKGGFTITTAGTKTFNLNGHTFSHLPLSHGPNYDPEGDPEDPMNLALPARGETFQFNVKDTIFVINGADAAGNNGKIVKKSSANNLFKQGSDSVTCTNLVVSGVDFDITGSGFFGRRSGKSTFDASFTDCSFTFAGTLGYQKSGNTSYTTWDSVNTSPDLNVVGLSATRENFSYINCTAPSFSISNGNVKIVGGDMKISSVSNAELILTGGKVSITSTVKNSELTIGGGADVTCLNSLSNTTVVATDSKLLAEKDVTDTSFTTNDAALTFYSAITGGSFDMTGGSALFGSAVKTISDCEIKTNGSSFSFTTTANKTTTLVNCPVELIGGSFTAPTTTNTVGFDGCTVAMDGVDISASALIRFSNCPSVAIKNSTGKLSTVYYNNVEYYAETGERATVLFQKSNINITGCNYFQSYVDATLDGCAIESSTNAFRTVKDDNGTYNGLSTNEDGKKEGSESSSTLYVVNTSWTMSSSSAYFVAGGDYSKVTIDVGTKVNKAGTINGQAYNIAEGCYVAANTGDDAEAFPYIVKKLDFSALKPMANLTLYTDIQFNLYLSYETAYEYFTAVTVNGTTINRGDLETVTDSEGNIIYYVVPYTVAAHAADELIEFKFTPVNKGNAVYNITKTVSVPEYIELVYGDAKHADAYALMSDLVDYAEASIKYFGDIEADNDFTALKSNDNYEANANTEIVGSEVNYENVKGYLKGAYLNVENSKTKFVFVAGTADKVTLSYKSATGEDIAVTYESCNADDLLELELRAYDLNAVITITVNDTITGTYDLAAYAASEDAADAADILLEMYNYAVSAKAYKFPEND